MDLPFFQLDAFVAPPGRPDPPGTAGAPPRDRFDGNPAAVVLLPGAAPWPSDATLQAVAEENNLSETAFLHPEVPAEATPAPVDAPAYHLRWCTPAVEVDLCGHATLASAGVLFDEVHRDADRLAFWTRSGWLVAERAGVATDVGAAAVTLDFPAAALHPTTVEPALLAAVGVQPTETLRATDVVLVLAGADDVRSTDPDLAALRRHDVRGVVVTAPGDTPGVDVVSRFFGAAAGVGEDPVTGSAHSQFARYWADRLGRTSFTARQLSPRGGAVEVTLAGDRARLTGHYRRVVDGLFHLP